MDLDPDTSTGSLCDPSTEVYSLVDPGAPQWACLDDVDRVPACCTVARGSFVECEAPIEMVAL